ncbi:MAG: Gfo/Idh/MocA family oxidoreductase [Fimbriimonadaceae bacterium]|nr:Gfo/Idh/MocA family oxidoreductase [Fimbriimonadaceae bacterium]QYK59265.1 MAG: Gfo/Idh/MocA family oxidoreductase [Fimbriimonadaceae bacterium]
MSASKRVALVGAGAMAKAHALAFSAAGAEFVGLTSRTLPKAEALVGELGAGRAVASVHELKDQLAPEIIVVAASVLAIPEVVESLLPTEAVLLIEKPAGPDLEAAERLAAILARCQARAYVALNRRFFASTRWSLDELPQGSRTVVVQDQQSRARAQEVGHPEGVVRNWHFANSIHLVDLLRVLARGQVTGVDVLQRPGPVGGVLVAGVQFDSGDFGVYQAVWEGPGPWAATVNCGPVRVSMQPLESAVRQTLGSREVVSMTPDPLDQDFKPGLVRQAQAAVAAAHGEASSLPTVADALESMRLADRFYSG